MTTVEPSFIPSYPTNVQDMNERLVFPTEFAGRNLPLIPQTEVDVVW